MIKNTKRPPALKKVVAKLKKSREYSINSYTLKHLLQNLTGQYITSDALVSELKKQRFEIRPAGWPNNPNHHVKIDLKHLKNLLYATNI